ncbi:hypothetical protein BDZ89DRAFT_360826 [Hymenopellis radicata]|nr:hypothetical protein BDZ89DRAFT_360826 [Hymenopellis radicata]
MPETIRSLLSMKFSRVHSSAEELASRGMTRDLGPTLSSTSSKRSLIVMLSLSSDVVESDRHFFPLYKDLLAWQGPFLDYFLMHLADNLKLKHVKFINNLPRLFAQAVLEYPGLDFEIPKKYEFSSFRRGKTLFRWQRSGGPQVETLAELVEAHEYRERLAAGLASVLVGNARLRSEDSDIADTDNARTITWTNTPRTLLPGCEAARAAGYFSIDPAFPGIAESIKTDRREAFAAVNRFHLADAAVTDIQPVCAPLNPEFPFFAMVQIAKQDIELLPEVLESFTCAGPEHPERYCGSSSCTCGPDGFEQLTVSGRPTGVDGHVALELIRKAETTNFPYLLPLSTPQLKTGTLSLLHAWGNAVASDSTFVTISGHNKYVFGIRERESQTLYLSEVQEIDRDPLTSYPGHLPAQLGYVALAFEDACSRGAHLEHRRRSGTLPHRFRQYLDNEIDPLNSDLPFEKLKLFYERDVGVFLPPALSNPEYTFDFNSSMFLRASEVLIHWDADDAAALQYMVGKSQSPLRLGVVELDSELDAVVEVDSESDAPQMYSSSRPGYTVDVKIHCWKQHGERVFLCHLINDNVDKTPFGRPIIMKACPSRYTSEVDEPSAVLRAIEAGRDTQDLEHEVDVLKRLERNDTLNSRVPRVYRFFSRPIKKDMSDFKFSAYFMEDCEGYYPLGIADAVSPTLRDNLLAWLDTLHKNHFVHRNLSCENILFNPSKPDSFYVTGWGRSLSMSDGTEISNWDEYVAHDIESLRTLFIRQEPNSVPPKKRARYNDDGVDGESMQEDDSLYAQDVEDWDELRNFLSQSPSPSGRWVAEHIAEQAAPMHTWWST